MTVYHGKNGVVYMSTTGTGTAVRVLRQTTWSLDLSTDTVEVTAFGDSNKVYVQGLRDVKGSLAGFWDDTDDSLFDGSESADGVKMYLYPTSLNPTVYFYGPAWLDVSINTGVSQAVQVSGNFVASGAWGRKP